ncbi:MAG: hypothetical protein JJ975_00480 [Bacteroidia bacterium]|nr:hypothetical protein [Bacteroidia bacterium]
MKKHKGQFIGTQFIILVIPLIPIQSHFFIGEYGRSIEIGWYWRQIVKAYMVFISLLGGIAVIGMSAAPGNNNIIENKTLAFGLVVACIAALIYFGFFIGRMNEEEKELRDLYGDAVGMNALPEYLNQKAAKELLRSLSLDFMTKTKSDWGQLVKEGSYTSEQVPMLFALTGYQLKIESSPMMELKHQKLLEEYKEIKKKRLLNNDKA